ncbi:hypothetical protein QYE76_006819 [Lolium multiflorum]|uniref:F-box domain-containing protein n=1 Tax=Lolium multiflorum TaxID=4521 RepID=A0AAD8RXP1_LOLMU|nr:hypothetical protein QYE76_006819 [Lolium multiflorum]
MLPRGSKTQKTAADVDAASIAQLPSDVIAVILLRLPASDLRRCRRVCKEWRDIISDPSFIDAHQVHGPRAPTHTIVFYPGSRPADGAHESLNGGGFLFDEQWRVTARFTVDQSAEMIGTCTGLLCFRVSAHGVIKVVEPFTGESISLPLPPTANAKTCSTTAYCFGFDARARRYKIVHGAFEGKVNYDGYFFRPRVQQELQVLTVGADTDWRTVRIRGERHGVLYGAPACDDGAAVYWYAVHRSTEHHGDVYRNVRFDLATEKVTSRFRRLVDGVISCEYSPKLYLLHMIGIRWFGEVNLEDGCSWWKHVDAVPHEVYCVTHSTGQCLWGRRALQRGHLLLRQQKEGDLHAHAILKSSESTLDIDYQWKRDSKPSIEIGCEEEDLTDTEKYRFFPVRRFCQDSSEVDLPVTVRLPPQRQAITTFAYVPTVSPAPFALYLGTSVVNQRKFEP